MNDISSGTVSSGASGAKKRRGRKKAVRKSLRNGTDSPEGDSGSPEEDMKRKQEKIDKRKELMQKHMEEVKWQAVDKILNEKGRKEREKEKKAKKQQEDAKAKEAADEAKKRSALTDIHIRYCRDGSITLSFPQGFLLPAVLTQEDGTNGSMSVQSAQSISHIKNGACVRLGTSICMKCGKPSKYCNPKNKKLSCSLQCYKELN